MTSFSRAYITDVDGFTLQELIEQSLNLEKSSHTLFPPDMIFLSHSETTFDDVKHLLYGGVQFIVFELDKYGMDSSLNSLYEYSKERFPDKIYKSRDEAEEFIKANGIRPNGGNHTDSLKISFSDFKLNSDGLIPCIAQDYKTGEVLMMAYMNEESYKKTLETGLMTYWSRSRQKLWTKGEESGHFSFVRSLDIDCDKDTILAKVHQIGPACHTGNTSCFFTPLVRDGRKADPSPENVLTDVYDVIIDRKDHPREGSYTNYLFEKGIDKILKKVGEEATEIVIAAKNPDKDEIKYEIADFLYHTMVLMAERGVTWEDIADELARRE